MLMEAKNSCPQKMSYEQKKKRSKKRKFSTTTDALSTKNIL